MARAWPLILLLAGLFAQDEEYLKRLKEVAALRADALAKLGQWCLQNGMPATARSTFQQAIAAVPDHAEAKKGLESVPLNAGDVASEKLAEARIRLLRPLADALAALGEWCDKAGLKAQAAAHLTEAVGIDPDHKRARKALGHEKAGDRWLPADEARAERKRLDEIKRRQANLVSWSFTITYPGDIPKDWYEKTKFEDRMVHGCRILWWATRGQMYIKEIRISDQTPSPGDFAMDSLDGNLNQKGAYGSGVNPVVVGGMFGGGTIVHELMHIKLGVGDEYGCPDCVMTQPKDGWGTPNFCDGRTHVAKSRETHCWSLLQSQFPKLQWPVKIQGELGNYLKPPEEEWGPMPPPKITVSDR